MADTVRLTVVTGPHVGRRFCFRGASNCVVGRAPECDLRFFGTERDRRVSRHHCELVIDAPMLLVHDLGSTNGTYLNGHRLATGPETLSKSRSGDVVTVGGTSFQVDMIDCPDGLEDGTGEPIWHDGENAVEDCPIPCPVDGAMPCVGCCAGNSFTPRTPPSPDAG
jgi:pSer/pThr/pTyr-binding forkhead associated (FHA) protein